MKLTLGIIFLLVFWLIFSFPTNTHTLFYDSAIKNILTEDIAETKEALSKLANTDSRVEQLENEKLAKATELSTIIENYIAEVNNPQNLGHGNKAEKHLAEFNAKLIPLGCNTKAESLKPYPTKKNQLRDYTERMSSKLVNITGGLTIGNHQFTLQRLKRTPISSSINIVRQIKPCAWALCIGKRNFSKFIIEHHLPLCFRVLWFCSEPSSHS